MISMISMVSMNTDRMGMVSEQKYFTSRMFFCREQSPDIVLSYTNPLKVPRVSQEPATNQSSRARNTQRQ